MVWWPRTRRLGLDLGLDAEQFYPLGWFPTHLYRSLPVLDVQYSGRLTAGGKEQQGAP